MTTLHDPVSIYLVLVTFGLCFVYLFLEYVFNLFFEKHLVHLSKRSIGSVAVIVFVSFLGYFLVSLIPDIETSNRLLHMFGGGFLGMMVCFLVVKDSCIHITRFQFFVFSFFVVTALGVSNEIMEFVLHRYFGLEFATHVTDTSLDLISNTIGIIIGSIAFTPFVKNDKLDTQ
ncbi:MAG: hypothetical protein M3Q80_02460 [bacterium]|nr:hypothetical protein [bacterium]